MNQIMLNSNDDLTSDLLEAGVVTWDDIVRSVQCFHYGRNSNRGDLNLVWYERKGSCSSKHAFLKHVALLNDIPNIELILAFYRMDENNTPGIGTILSDNELSYIPEAHCYLRVNGKALDITNIHSDFNRYKNYIIESKVIQPNDVIENKVIWHKEFIRKWIEETQQSKYFDELWSIREACIAKLEKRD